MSKNEIYDHRKSKFLKIGRDGGFIKPSEFDQSKLGYSEPSIQILTRHIKKNKYGCRNSSSNCQQTEQ